MATAAASSLSQTPKPASDLTYCKEIAKRSAARAALHLGIDSMSRDALDVLGDVLLAYLERLGNVMANTVESSSRTSAHCNVFDALHAADTCTTTSMMGGGWEELASFLYGPQWMTLQPTTTTATAVPNGNRAIVTNGGLNSEIAQFSNGEGRLVTDTGGKQPPSNVPGVTTSVISDGHQAEVGRQQDGELNGWNAPYLDEVQPFPINRRIKANPHRLPKSISASFHNCYAKEEEACRVDAGPHLHDGMMDDERAAAANRAEERAEMTLKGISDDAFLDGRTLFWGCDSISNKEGTIDSIAARRRKDGLDKTEVISSGENQEVTTEDTTIKKRAKFDDVGDQGKKNLKTEEHDAAPLADSILNDAHAHGKRRRPAYVPPFMPPFPFDRMYGQAAFLSEIALPSGANKKSLKEQHGQQQQQHQQLTGRTKTANGEEEGLNSVRSSLVQLGRTVGTNYWGSGWKEDTPFNIAVPSGRPGALARTASTDAAAIGASSAPVVVAAASLPPPDFAVVPLGRASGSRASRILEGSMDAYQ